MADPKNAAYTAGFIDGEGCIGIASMKGCLSIAVTISNTDRRPLDFIQSIYSGTIIFIQRAKNGENWKPVWMWRVWSRKAEALLRDIRPFLIVKAAQADLALQFRDEMNSGAKLSRGKDYRPESDKDQAILARRLEMKAQMHKLNHRGLN